MCWFVSAFLCLCLIWVFFPSSLTFCCFSTSFSVPLSLYLCLSDSFCLSLSLFISLPLCFSGFLSLSLILSVFRSWLSLSLPWDSPLQSLSSKRILDILGLREAASLPPLNTQVAPSSPSPEAVAQGMGRETWQRRTLPPPELQGLSSAVSLCVAMSVDGSQDALGPGEGESHGAAKVCALLAPAAEAGK